MAKFQKQRKDVTSFEEIPTEMIDALVSTEDRDFYQHVGVNPKGILRAGIQDLFHHSYDQGGSTITQQLVKNQYLTTGKTLERKMTEAIYATAVEQKLTKKQIITSYLNNSDFIYNSFGVKNAIETYYGESIESFKKEDRVTRIAKSALLIGLLNSPTQFNPFTNPDKALARRNIVINNMKVVNYISKDEYDKAIEKPLMVLDKPKVVHDDEKKQYPEFVSYVLEEIRQHYHLNSVTDAQYIGMNVYTSFDPKVYNIIRNTVQNADLFPADAKDGEQVETAVSVVNPKNGEIMALTGGRQAPGFLELNRAYQFQRQPGSSIKPLLDYGPAVESGKFNPWSVLPDNQGMDFGGGYSVHNFGHVQYGRLTMTQALTLSENVPAVYLLSQTGINYAKQFAEKQGIKFAPEDKYLPMALGGLTNGVNVLQESDGYQGFANGGYRIPAHAIRKIVSNTGKVDYRAPDQLSEQYRTMKPQTAEYLKYMMRNGVQEGTGMQANVPGSFIAGKTGTAEFPGLDGRNRDLWFTGFSNTFVASVWMGFDNPSPEKSFDNTQTSWLSARIFGQIAQQLLEMYPSPLDGYQPPSEPSQDGSTSNQNNDIAQIALKGQFNSKDSKVSLSWNSVNNANLWIYRDGVVVKRVNSNTYDDTTVDNDNNYIYQIVAYDKDTNQKIGESNSLTISTAKNNSGTESQQGDNSKNNGNQNDSQDLSSISSNPADNIDNKTTTDTQSTTNNTKTESVKDKKN